MEKEEIKLLETANELYFLKGKHIIFQNADEVSLQVVFDRRDYLCKEALSKNYKFIVFYQNKKDRFDYGVYVAPYVTYKNLLNAFLREDDEYWVYNTANNIWESGKYKRSDFPVKENITLDNCRTIWYD